MTAQHAKATETRQARSSEHAARGTAGSDCCRRRVQDGRVPVLIVACGAAGVLATATALPALVRLVFVIAFAAVAPGGAVLLWYRGLTTAARAVIVPALGVSVITLLVAFEALSRHWFPTWTSIVLALASVGSVAVYEPVRRRQRGITALELDPPGPVADDEHVSTTHVTEPGPWTLRRAKLSLYLLGAALVAWAVALPSIGTTAPSSYSLLLTSFPMWAATVFTALAAVAGLRSRSATALLASTVTLVLIERLSASIGTAVPLFPWTYKHIAVVDFIDHFGYAARGVDVYHNWPGMFALMAWVHTNTGITPLAMAHWFTPLYHLGLVAASYGAARAWRLSAVQAAAAAFVLEAVNCVGQDYFSPQAVAFLLAFGILAGLGVTLSAGRPVVTAPLIIVFGAITVSHQLTPYWIVCLVGALVVLRRARPWWLPVVFAVIALTYTYWNYSIVSRFGVVSNPDPISNVRLSASPTPEPGFAVSFYTEVVAFGLVMIVTGIVLINLLFRRGEWRVPLAMVVSPLLLITVQNYGGEAIFRVILYALPAMCSIVAVVAVRAVPVRTFRESRPAVVRGATRVARPTLWLLTVVATLASGISSLGGWTVYRVDPSQLSVWETFNREAPARSYLLTPGPGFPANPEWYYVGRVTQNGNYAEALFGSAAAATNFSNEADYEALMADLTSTYGIGDRDVYLALSDGNQRYGQIAGYLPKGATANLRRLIDADPRWRPVTVDGGSQLFQLRGVGAPKS